MAHDGLPFEAGAPRVWSIPPGEDFIRLLSATLASGSGLAERPDALADAIVYVPNRRSAKALSLALFIASGEQAILPPDIRALGDLESDDAPPVKESALADLLPALSPAKRLGALAAMVQAYYKSGFGTEVPPSSALAAAQELARLLDQAQLSRDVDWGPLPKLAKEADLEGHWASSAKFLEIVTAHWPDWLAEQGVMDPMARRLAAAEAMALDWERRPPQAPVIIAGSTGATPASRVLMKAALRLPQGLVVLPGLDTGMQPEVQARILSEVGHPQFALLETLQELGVDVGDVAEWPGASATARRQARRQIIHEALAPADDTADWRQTLDSLAAQSGKSLVAFAETALDGLSVIEAPDEAAEALAAALILRETLETPGRTAALVTPDAGLARRVSALLKRWGVDVPPSAGTPLVRTPAGSFIGLCAQWASDPGDPVRLLSVLKHKLASDVPGLADLELFFLRGPRRWQSLDELAASIRTRHEIEPYPRFRREHQAAAEALVRRLAETVRKAGADFSQTPRISGADAVERIAALASAVSETPLPWAGEDGAVASRLLEFIREMSEPLGPMTPEAVADLINMRAMQMTVSAGRAEHPRLSIWGPLEARLQSADRLVLAGLNEDVWPKRPPPDAFLPRRFRAELGLNDPEDRMGLSAHDFAQLACAPDVTLLYSARRDDAPAVASRWVWRLKTLAVGALEDRAEDVLRPKGTNPLEWVEALKSDGLGSLGDDFPVEPRPSMRPEGWPKKLSVTRVDLLQRDPYALWAEQVLGLSRLDPLNADLGPAPRGTAIHKALEDLEEEGAPKSADHLLSLIERELRKVGETEDAFAARRAVWRRTSEWYIDWRAQRDTGGGKPRFEVKGGIDLGEIDGAPFRLTATADRIERTSNGDLVIVDFKTGNPPREKEVATGLSQQMPLQALIAREGGYDKIPPARVDQLHYVAFKAKPEAFSLGGRHGLPSEPSEMADIAREGLLKLIADYRKPTSMFLSAPRVKFVKYDNGYNLLARRAEWASDTQDGEGGDA